MTGEGYGRWSWIYECGHEPDLAAKSPGRVGEHCVCLPPEFIDRVGQVDLLRRVNVRFGTLLDHFEEEDVDSPECPAFIAGSLETAFRDHEIESTVGELVEFLVDSARH